MEPRPAFLPRDRAAANRRRTRLFLVLFGLAALPSVAYVGQYLMFWGLFVLVPIAGDMGLVAFFVLDALLVILAMAFALVWLYQSAMTSLLRAIQARPLEDGEARELERAVQNMAIASGLPVPALYLMDTPAPNLVAVGVNPDDSAVVATTGLVSLLDRRELEGVAAHALAQIANRDTQLDTLLAAGVRWLRLPGTLLGKLFRGMARLAAQFGAAGWGCLAALGLWMGVPMLLSIIWGFQDPDIRPLAALATVLNLYVIVGGPLTVALIARVVARERKHLADAEAIQLTRYPVGLAQALAKVDAAGGSYPQARGETANLHFADPIAGDTWYAALFDSHPPAAERIAVISRLGGQVLPGEVQEAKRQGAAYRDISRPAMAERDPGSEPSPVVAALDTGPLRLSLIRLLEATPLLAGPDAAATVRGSIPPGMRVTVLAEHGDFIEVVTPADQFGFVRRDARFEEVEPPNLRRADGT